MAIREVPVKSVDEEQELARLLAAEPSPLASGLAALRDHGPDAAELASLASRLALQGIDVSVQQPPARVNPWKKWTLGGLGGTSAVVVWWALHGSQPTPSGTAPGGEAGLLRSATTAVTAEPVAPRRPSLAAVDRGAPVPAAESASPNPASVSPSTTANGTATSPVAEPGPSNALHEGKSGSDLRETAGSSSDRAVAMPHGAAAASAAASAPQGAPLSVGPAVPASELELLRDARLALRQSPARALQLTEEHARSYPRGKMTQERELIAVSALVALGRRAAALSRAANFERLYPTSPYRKQMNDLLK